MAASSSRKIDRPCKSAVISPSLLKGIDLKKPVPKRSNLGMDDYMDEHAFVAVFYCNGKSFCLRGGKEHRNLKISQLSRRSNPNCYIYRENGSKNYSGGFMKLHVEKQSSP